MSIHSRYILTAIGTGTLFYSAYKMRHYIRIHNGPPSRPFHRNDIIDSKRNDDLNSKTKNNHGNIEDSKVYKDMESALGEITDDERHFKIVSVDNTCPYGNLDHVIQKQEENKQKEMSGKCFKLEDEAAIYL